MFVNKNGNPVNLYSLPTVDILDAKGNPISSLTGLTTTHVKNGVYRVDFGIAGVDCSGKAFFYDVWKNLYTHYQVQVPDVKQKFIPRALNSDYQLGENLKEYDRYVIQFYGVQQNEKIKRGDIRKIVVNFRSINSTTPKVVDEAYFRMFIKEGNIDVQIHDWTLLDTTNENFFTLNTMNYIPRNYFIELKAKVNGDEIIYNDIIKFEILSEK